MFVVDVKNTEIKMSHFDRSGQTLPFKIKLHPNMHIEHPNTVFLLINDPRAMQSVDREPLFCTQVAK